MLTLPAGMLLQPHPACLPPGWRPCVCAPPRVLLPPHAGKQNCRELAVGEHERHVNCACWNAAAAPSCLPAARLVYSLCLCAPPHVLLPPHAGKQDCSELALGNHMRHGETLLAEVCNCREQTEPVVDLYSALLCICPRGSSSSRQKT